MRKFIVNFLLFIGIVFLLFFTGFILPATQKSRSSLLFGYPAKKFLLENADSPRIILIGGSNLSFGINSQLIKDSLGLNPINTAIIASIGLIQMINNVIPHVRKGDIVIVCGEYTQYLGTTAYGQEELLRLAMDVDRKQLFTFNMKQLVNVLPYVPKYAISKLVPKEYSYPIDPNDLYGANSFNKFGDATKHWKLTKSFVAPNNKLGESLNYDVFDHLAIFKDFVEKRSASFFVSFPSYQSSSFENNILPIGRIYAELIKRKFVLLGTPERYKFADSLMFNTAYHLTKEGLDMRTHMLIADIRKRK